MEKLIENEELLAEFAKAIFRDVERDISESNKTLENKSNQGAVWMIFINILHL